MSDAHDAIDAAIAETDRLRRSLKKSGTTQVRSTEERALIKATALTWFRTHRPLVAKTTDGHLLEDVDGLFKDLLGSSDHAAMRSGYDTSLKAIRNELAELRIHSISVAPIQPAVTVDDPPDFAPLIADAMMQGILIRRWRECSACISAGAPLAATVMMGAFWRRSSWRASITK